MEATSMTTFKESTAKRDFVIFWQKLSWYIGDVIYQKILKYRVELPKESVITTKPLLIISNHQGISDTWLLLATLPRGWFWKIAPARLVVTQYFRNPFMNLIHPFIIWPFVYWPNGVIYLPHPNKEKNGKLSIEEKTQGIVNALKRGDTVVLFAEGHVNKTGTLKEYKRGPAYIQKKTGVPILLVTINRKKRIIRWDKEQVMTPEELDEVAGSAWLKDRAERIYRQ